MKICTFKNHKLEFQHVIHEIEVIESNKIAYQDIKDRLINLILTFDEVSDDSNNLMNTYLSVHAQKTNEVMKLLTVFSAFFLPLTFIAGIYGILFCNYRINGNFINCNILVVQKKENFIKIKTLFVINTSSFS